MYIYTHEADAIVTQTNTHPELEYNIILYYPPVQR